MTFFEVDGFFHANASSFRVYEDIYTGGGIFLYLVIYYCNFIQIFSISKSLLILLQFLIGVGATTEANSVAVDELSGRYSAEVAKLIPIQDTRSHLCLHSYRLPINIFAPLGDRKIRMSQDHTGRVFLWAKVVITFV